MDLPLIALGTLETIGERDDPYACFAPLENAELEGDLPQRPGRVHAVGYQMQVPW